MLPGVGVADGLLCAGRCRGGGFDSDSSCCYRPWIYFVLARDKWGDGRRQTQALLAFPV
jgi:hypothetical protein